MEPAKKPDEIISQIQPAATRDVSNGETEVIANLAKYTIGDEHDKVLEYLRNYVPDTEEEKRLIRKVDLFLIPMLWLMCVLAYLDRNNIGNADAAGMSTDLNLTDSNYSMLISIFFIAYVIWEVPSNLILSRCRLSWYLPGLMLVWGAVVTVMSEVKTYHHILVIRFFLGIIEAGFFPGVLYIMTCWYKRNEIGKRFCIFFTALCVAGAVSGLISGAVMSGLDGYSGKAGWHWLFLIDGVITMGIAIVAWFTLPDFPHQNSRIFTLEERLLAQARILHDKAQVSQSRKKLSSLQAVHAAVVDLRTYVFIILYMTQNGSTTVSYFIPTVLKSMGYSGTKAQWMTVPIWAVATFFLLVFPQTSDRFNDRRWHIAGGLSVAFISSIVSVSVVNNNNVRYAMMCFYIAGLYMTLPLILNWASELMALPTEKRAVVIAMVNCVGSLSSIYGGYLWPSTDAPHYTMGFTTVSVFIGFGAVLAACLPIIFKYLPVNTTKAMRQLEMEDEDQIA